MKKRISVLHISTADNLGGSGRSAFKIHKGLRDAGLDSKMLVSRQITSDPGVDRISKTWLKAADLVTGFITNKVGLQYVFYPSTYALLSHPWFKGADIIQIYNTHGDYFSHSFLPFISRHKKVVWRLSDMWPVTGHCAYSGDCDRWMIGCGKCPQLDVYPSLPWDFTSLLWRWKKFIYSKSNVHIVAPSSWIRNIAENSPLLKTFSKSTIINGVDTMVFKPLPQEWSRTILNIPQKIKTILYSAHVIQDNPRKGGDLFIQAVNKLNAQGENNLMVLIVGEGAEKWGHELKCPVWRHGLINEDELLSLVYNSADVMVNPAVVENLPNSIIEAMACGTPSVAFDTGGIKEVLTHMNTGYLAKYLDIEDLAYGIQTVLNNNVLRHSMANECLARVGNGLTVEMQASSYKHLYEGLLDRTKP